MIIEGRPRIEVTVEATDEGGNRAAGGNATAVGRLVNAIDWLVEAEPGLYDALDVPLRPAVGHSSEGQRPCTSTSPRARTPSSTCGARWSRASGSPPRSSRLAVYAHTTLGLREFEAARLRIAQINGCLFCLDWRTERDGEKVEDGFADAVTDWRTTDAFDDRTRLAAEYAERYALDHHGLDDEFWAPDERALQPARDRRAEHVHRLVAGLRPAQPRARPRHRLRAAQPPRVELSRPPGAGFGCTAA